jgi:hypothetical protein
VTGAGRPAQLPHGNDDRPARPLPVVLLDGKHQIHQHHIGSSLGTFGSIRVLLSLTASSERRNRLPEDGMTRQCAAAHGVGASRITRMRIDRPAYSIHSRHSMDQSIILSLSSTRETVTLRRHADSATSRPIAAADQRSGALRRRAVRDGPDAPANAQCHPLSATRRGDRDPARAPSGGCSANASSRRP